MDNHQKAGENLEQRARTGLRIPYELNTWLTLEAQKQGFSKNALILKILWKYKKQRDEEKIIKNKEQIIK